MTINELHIKFDLQPENKINVLKDAAAKCNEGYLFADSSNGHCYLFDKDGNEDDVKKLKKIDNELFYNSDISSIIIPDSVERIEYGAFSHCKSLTLIVIPNSVESIGKFAFWCCESLKSIIIPNSVESIRDYAFWCCESLKSIIIPNSVKSIGKYAFEWCESLESLIFKGKIIHHVKAMNNYPFGIEDESIIRCI